MSMCGSHRGQKRVLGPLELELEDWDPICMCIWKLNDILLKMLLTLAISLQPPEFLFKICFYFYLCLHVYRSECHIYTGCLWRSEKSIGPWS